MKNYSVIDLLGDYSLNSSKLKLIGYNDKTSKELEELREQMKQLDFCIDCLPSEEKDVIKQLYIQKVSIRQLSKIGIMSRSSVIRKRDKAIKMLENLVETLKF